MAAREEVPAASAAPPEARGRWAGTVDVASGMFAGAAAMTTGFPFDTVKVNLQSHGGSSSLGVARDIVAKDGFRGLFRGLSPQLIGGSVECGVNYFTYEWALSALTARGLSPASAVPLAAAGAGATLSIILGPTELIKCRMQSGDVEGRRRPRTAVACVRGIVEREGARGLARGLGATMAREVPGNAIYFATYVALKEGVRKAWEWKHQRWGGGDQEGALQGADGARSAERSGNSPLSSSTPTSASPHKHPRGAPPSSPAPPPVPEYLPMDPFTPSAPFLDIDAEISAPSSSSSSSSFSSAGPGSPPLPPSSAGPGSPPLPPSSAGPGSPPLPPSSAGPAPAPSSPPLPAPPLPPLLAAGSAVLCGGLAGVTMWTLVLPLDAAKTRVQVAERGSTRDIGFLRSLRELKRTGQLFAGLRPTLLRAFPANAAQWGAYELAQWVGGKLLGE